MARELVEHTQRRPGATIQGFEACSVSGEELIESQSGISRLLRHLRDADQEEAQPFFPIAVPSHSGEEFEVSRSLLLQVEAQVQQRLLEQTLGA